MFNRHLIYLLPALFLQFSCKAQRSGLLEEPAAPPKASGGWRADFATLDGRIEVASAMIARHPRLLFQTLQFERNLLEAIEEVDGIYKELGPLAHDPVVPDMGELLVYNFQGENLQPNLEAIKAIKSQLTTNLSAVIAALGAPNSLAQDLQRLPPNATLLTQFFTVMPFLYDVHSGTMKANPEREIDAAGRAELSNIFQDIVPEHYHKLIQDILDGRVAYKNAWNKFSQSFVRGALQSALLMVNAAGQKVQSKMISIERVTPVMSTYCVFGDCSILSTPFHGHHKDVITYWVRNIDRSASHPDGQAIVIMEEGIPYAVTVNGLITPEGVGVVLGLIAHDLGATEMYRPDFDKVTAVVNTDDMKVGMRLEGEKPVTLSPPAGWDIVDRYTEEHNNTDYENYYLFDSIKAAFRGKPVALNPNQIRRIPILNPYPKTKQMMSRPLKERALLAAQLSSDLPLDKQEQVTKRMGINAEQLTAAVKLTRTTEENGFSFGDFQEAKRVLGFTIEDIAHFPVGPACLMLGNFYDSLSDEEKKTAQKMAKGLSADLQHYEETLGEERLSQEAVRLNLEWAKASLTAVDQGVEAAYERLSAKHPLDLIFSWSAIFNHLYFNKMAMDQGAKVGARGDEAFRWAAEYELLDMMEFLVSKGANVNTADGQSLRLAAMDGSLDVVKFLVRHGANIHYRGEQALNWAARKGHDDVVKFLLESGADASKVAPLEKHTAEVSRLLNESRSAASARDPRQSLNCGEVKQQVGGRR